MFLADCLFIFANFAILGLSHLFLNFVLFLFEHIFACIVITRVLNRFFPIIPGTFSINSHECNRWEAHGIIALSACIYFEPIIPFLLKPLWYRLFGLKIGKNSTTVGRIIDPSITTIGDNVSIGAESLILGHQKFKDTIVIGPNGH